MKRRNDVKRFAPALSTGILLLCLTTLMMHSTHSAGADELDSDTAVCGWWREPFMFWLWRTLAGSPSTQRAARVRDVEAIQFTARDGIELGGYKLAAANPKGYLLVAQGNAMLADQLVDDLQRFRDLALDVYVFDYRGYGRSRGKSRLAAIVADYAEIVAHLNRQRYGRQLLYGLSMGGVILLNAVGESRQYSRMVVDSSPSRISHLGCPERFDPVAHLPQDSSPLMIISGARDNVIPPGQIDEMIRLAESRGARILRDENFAHPFQDAAEAVHQRRQKEVATFLLRDSQ